MEIKVLGTGCCSKWKTRARVTPRADKALTPDIFYD